jgi:hypothetical protein
MRISRRVFLYLWGVQDCFHGDRQEDDDREAELEEVIEKIRAEACKPRQTLQATACDRAYLCRTSRIEPCLMNGIGGPFKIKRHATNGNYSVENKNGRAC